MATKVVRILIEDKMTKDLHWYATYECDESDILLGVEPGKVRCESADADNLLTTFSTSVSFIDLAIELYKASGGTLSWNEMPTTSRMNWIAVAERVTQLGPLFVSPQAKQPAPRTFFDFSDVSEMGGEAG